MKKDVDFKFLQWLCANTSTFKVVIRNFNIVLDYTNYGKTISYSFDGNGTCILYPTLLQEAIEGFNQKMLKIDDDYSYIDVMSDCINYSFGVNDRWRRGEHGSSNWFYSEVSSEAEAKEVVLMKLYRGEE